ncbi:MAG: NAD-glutamate dehydrogenase [Rhodocyclaceae bacterium]|nr:NAD-glutamate dehydrogenase [Rhodocyclaceae bacterium]
MFVMPDSCPSPVLADIDAGLLSRCQAEQLPRARELAGIFFGAIDSGDLASRSVSSWVEIVLGYLAFADTYSAGAPKLRIVDPVTDAQGWGAGTSLVQVINADKPFLVDSVTMELHRQGYHPQLVVHPLIAATRSADGCLAGLTVPQAGSSGAESWIHVEIERVPDAAAVVALEQGLQQMLGDLYAAVADWLAIKGKVSEVLGGLGGAAKVVALEELDEARAYLAWVADNHFTFLGYQDYDRINESGRVTLRPVAGSGLGILREGAGAARFEDLHAAAADGNPEQGTHLLLLTKATARATVHRPGQMDQIGVNRFDAAGNWVGERRFVGMYTSNTYHANLQDVPLLRQKVAQVMQRSGFPPNGHSGKSLAAVLETLPRDELLQIDTDTLFATAMGIMRLGTRSRTRMFVRRDIYGRFYSCLIYLPREAYNTELRLRFQSILRHAFGGADEASVDFNVQLSESVLARVHLLVRTDPALPVAQDMAAVEAEIIEAARRWEERVFEQVVRGHGETMALAMRRDLVLPLPAAYREQVSVAQAVADYVATVPLSETSPLVLALYVPEDEACSGLRLRMIRLGEPIPLSKSLPMLENMGVKVQDERSYVIERHGLAAAHIHDFGLSHDLGALDMAMIKPRFEDAFLRIWNREVENDGFNRLTLAAGLVSREIVMLRLFAKYLKQIGANFSQSYIEQILATHAGITRDLVAYFHARFDPRRDDSQVGAGDTAMAACIDRIEAALNAVSNADEDRVLRRIVAVMQASIRTNYYQNKPYLSVKLESAKVPDLPQPRPLYEIFVYSPRIEGIHLRGGKVARGGLRWSDRPEDFRTEVLGLVKAQMVKNAVIVPVGSKGGFVLKAAPPASDREAFMAEGIECYKTFLRGLLDITDNLVKGQVVVRENVVRHDGDDPYLVVAADKGTETFSDFANGVSLEYGHWLGDAFASGGSVGYDHKKMGITARGAWESVKRHFREMGVNTQTTDFTVAGVGDMSGDVFGNGMLLSRHIRLLAAFDHRHIFLDPNPEAGASFTERQRLFLLPRSSWEDYDKALISAGGGVYSRGAKSIPLSPEVRKVLDVTAESMTPADLMTAILKAPVDLFYNGGIGTYIKASHQTHAQVGDRANDAIRVDGRDLRCKVVAEGGNLGCTQLGRIEFALKGGRINTDAIDNSAGVDCSDHEVNIKILLNVVADTEPLPEAERNALLAQMTEEVGLQVLEDNYYQTQSLSVSGIRGEKMLDAQARYIRHLEKAGRLNRAVEFLPGEDEIAERKAKHIGLTSPERAVLLSYSKMELYDHLLASELIDDEYFLPTLIGYFPAPLGERYAEAMKRHPLRREIIATDLANATINRTGSVFIHRMQEETGATGPEVVRAYALAREVLGVGKLFNDIDALDDVIAARTQSDMLIDAGRLVLRAVLWFLRRTGARQSVSDVVAFFAPGVATVRHSMDALLAPADLAAVQAAEKRLKDAHVPEPIARQVARLDALYSVLDIVELASESERSVDLAAGTFYALSGRLDVSWVGRQITGLQADTHWQAMARAAMRDDLSALQRQVALSALRLAPEAEYLATVISAWEGHYVKTLARVGEVVSDLKSARDTDIAMLSVLLRELRMLA